MSDEISEQILEQVLLMRADVAALKDQVAAMFSDVGQLGQLFAEFAENQARHARDPAPLWARLDWIERRLELKD